MVEGPRCGGGGSKMKGNNYYFIVLKCLCGLYFWGQKRAKVSLCRDGGHMLWWSGICICGFNHWVQLRVYR